jgi:hypothetical protein
MYDFTFHPNISNISNTRSPVVDQAEPSDAQMQDDSPTAPASMDNTTITTTTKKRPRLDLSAGPERKRGKSMFGLVLGTLNKAKIEDKHRNASEAVSLLSVFFIVVC